MLNVLMIVIGVFLFLLVVCIHELGHFITAKACGVKVNEFAIGMGPKLIKIQGKETLYTLRLLPIGGFCAMEGEDEESSDERALGNKKVWQRLIIVAAGAIMNIILGLVFMLIIQGQSDMFGTTQLAVVPETSASYSCGLRENDVIYSINDYRVFCTQDASFAMALDEDGKMDFVVERNGEKLNLNIEFDRVENDGVMQTVLDFKVYGEEATFGTVLENTVTQTVSMIRMVYVSLWRLITGQSGMNDLAGPVGLVEAISDAAQAGFKESFLQAFNNVLEIMALITINLGIFNLLPLPALDGGRIVFLLIEWIFRKPVPAKYEGWIHFIGLALLMLLMLVVTFNDIVRLVKGG